MAKTTIKKFREEADRILERMRQRVTPFPIDEKERNERVKRASEDLLYFAHTYLPHYFYEPSDPPHREWAELTKITDMPVFAAGPPDTGKSALIEIALPLQQILFERYKYGGQFCKSLDQAGDRVFFVRLELDENERIKQDFGELKGRKWEEDDFITKTGVRYKAFSLKKGIYGLLWRQWRLGFALISDIEDDKTVASIKVTKKIAVWLIRHVKPRLAAGYKMIYFGNIIHPKMALKMLIDMKDAAGKKKYPGAIWTLRKHGKCQFPHLWTKARIAKEENAMGASEFARVYDFQGLDDDKKFRPEWYVIEPPEILIGVPMAFFGGIDPSPEPNAQKDNDQKAIVILGKELETEICHVVDAWGKVASVEEMFAAGFNLFDRWQKGFQQFLMKGPKVEELYRNLWQEAARKRGRLPLPIRCENEPLNKIMKIGNRLPPFFERGLLRFVTRNGHVARILDEADLFPDGSDDFLDALDMALEAAVRSYSLKNLVVEM